MPRNLKSRRFAAVPGSVRAGARGSARTSALVFAALGDQTRLQLIARLCDEGPLSITRLTSRSRITRQAITKHLRVMACAGLVRSRWRGRERLWELEQRRFDDARRYLDIISRQWDAALERLRAFVETNRK